MKTWTLELTEDELIALSRACVNYQEKLIALGWLTAEDMTALSHLEAIDGKMPEEDWFSAEVRA